MSRVDRAIAALREAAAALEALPPDLHRRNFLLGPIVSGPALVGEADWLSDVVAAVREGAGSAGSQIRVQRSECIACGATLGPAQHDVCGPCGSAHPAGYAVVPAHSLEQLVSAASALFGAHVQGEPFRDQWSALSEALAELARDT